MQETNRILELLRLLRGLPLTERAGAFYAVLKAMPDDVLAPSRALLSAVQPRNADDGQLLQLWAAWAAFVEGDRQVGKALLQEIARGLFYLPEPHALVGAAALLEGNRAEAVHAFRRGVRVDPQFAPLYDLLGDFGLRQPPVLGFLPRGHRINLLLGRLRARWHRHREGQAA